MVEIGGKPVLWHILKIYSHYGINDFIICLGYKGYLIKEYFANYLLHSTDVTIDLQSNHIETHRSDCEPWRITLIDTGLGTGTGGRLKRIIPYVGKDEVFCLTYGDGVSDIDINTLIAFHRRHGKAVTITSVQPKGRFGSLEIRDNGQIVHFTEKPKGDGRWVNGGFFVLSPRVADYIEGDHTTWEHEPLERLSRDGEVYAFKHDGFWQHMDTLPDRNLLEGLWASGTPPWKVW